MKGGKAKLAEKEEKRKADLARKAEAARLLAEEEANIKAAKPKPAAAAKKGKEKPAGPGAIAAGKAPEYKEEEEIESYAATGIDNALDLLDVVTAKADKASVGTQAANIERHPERRFKVRFSQIADGSQLTAIQGAFEAYQARELENVKKEHPGLRLQQYKDLLFKQFQKSPENP